MPYGGIEGINMNFDRAKTYQEIKNHELDLYDFDQEHCVVRPCLSITLFFKHGAKPYVRQILAKIFDQYMIQYGEFIQGGQYGNTKYGKKNKIAIAKIKGYMVDGDVSKLSLYSEISSVKTMYVAPEYRFSTFTRGEYTQDYKSSDGQIYQAGHDGGMLSALKMIFPIEFLSDDAKFQEYLGLLSLACELLPICGGYSGLSLSLPFDHDRYLPQEYSIATQFSGLDIDSYWFIIHKDYAVLSIRGEAPNKEYYPYEYKEEARIDSVGYIKGVNWINILPKIFFDRIGGYELAINKLKRDDVIITDSDDCVMIQNGENPQLGSKQQGLPEVYVFVNQVLKKLRNLKPDSLQPDLGGVENANQKNSKRWLERFDLDENMQTSLLEEKK